MKNFTFLFIFIFFSFGSFAQFPNFDANPSWKVAHTPIGSPQLKFSEDIAFDSKITICNQSYSLMLIQNGTKKDSFFLRNEGKKTFIRRSKQCSSKEFLLYDFGLQVGDSAWVMSSKINDSMQVKLLNIKQVNTISNNYKGYFLECSFKNNKQKREMIWKDGVGSLYHPLYFYHILPPSIDGDSYELMCNEGKTSNYSNPNYPGCKILPYDYRPFPLYEDQPRWEVTEFTYVNGPIAQFEIYHSIFYEKDTIICGLKYSKSRFKKQNIFIRNEGKNTFARLIPDCNSQEFLLYGFDLPNIPWFSSMSAPGFSQIKLALDMSFNPPDSIDVDGKKRQRLTFKTQSGYSETWIEGIGSTKHPFEILANRVSGIDSPFWTFTCFKDKSTQYATDSKSNCNVDFKPFPLHDDNPKWNELLKTNSFGGGTSLTTKTFVYDSKISICNKEYSLFIYSIDKMYVRNEGKKTYYRLSKDCNSKEYLLYDFDMKVGDQKYFRMMAGSADSSLFVLKKIDTTWHHFQKVRRFHYDFDYFVQSNGSKIIKKMILQEGVGSLWHPFFPVERLWRSLVDGPSFSLLCGDVGMEERYREDYFLRCDINIVPTIEVDEESQNWQISPNPFEENIQISTTENADKTHVTIFDLNGKVIYQSDFQTNININSSNFIKGIYFIQLKNNGKKVMRKMVKM
jgi:hypothetical protein